MTAETRTPPQLLPGARVVLVAGEVQVGATPRPGQVWVSLDGPGPEVMREVLVPHECVLPPQDTAAQLAVALDALREIADYLGTHHEQPDTCDFAMQRRQRALDALAQIADTAQPIDPGDVRDGDLVEVVEHVVFRAKAWRFDGDDRLGPPVLSHQETPRVQTTYRLIERGPSKENQQ